MNQFITPKTHLNAKRAQQFLNRIVVLLFLLAGTSFAATITSTTGGGNWNTSGTWVGSVVPTVGDDVVIDGPVTLNQNSGNLLSLTVNTGKTLTMSGVFTLATTGNMTVNGTYAGATSGVVTIGGNLSFGGTTFTIGAANFSVTGATTIAAGTFTDGTTLGTNTFTGLVTVSGGSLTTTGTNTSTWTFSGGLTNAGTVTFSANVLMNMGGNLTNNGTFSKTGNGVNVFSNTTSIGGSNAIAIAGLTTYNGPTTFTNTSTVTFANSQTYNTAVTVNNASTVVLSAGSINVSAGQTFTNNGTVTVASNVAITGNGVYTNNGTTTVNGITGSTGASTFTNAANSILNYNGLVGSFMASGVLDLTASNNTVNYSAGGAQGIKNIAHQNLGATGSGAKTPSAALTINGNLNIISGASIADAGFTVTVKGNITSAGSHTGSGKILLMGGSSTHLLSTTGGAPDFANIELNDALGATFSGISTSTVINGTLTLTAGDLTLAAFGATGLVMNSALTIPSGITVFNTSSTGARTFNADVTNNGTFSNATNPVYNFVGSFTNNSTFTSGSGLYTFSGTSKSISGSSATTITNATISGSYTNSSAGGLTVGVLSIPVAGSLTLNNNIAVSTSFAENGTLITNASQVFGAGTFTLANAATATLSVGSQNGIAASAATGSIVITGARIYGAAANYVFNSVNTPQITGDGFSAATALTINNTGVSGTVRQTNASVTVTGTLTLTAGTYHVGGASAASPNILTLNGPAIAGTSANLVTTSFSNLVFGGGSVGVSIPSSVTQLNALTSNNSSTAGISLNSNVTLNGTAAALTLTGRVNLGSFDLSLVSPTSTISGGSVAAMVVADGSGQIKKTFGTSGFSAFNFPVGDASGSYDYSPFSITFSANSTNRTIGVRVIDAVHPSNGAVADYATRYWTVSDNQAGVGTYTYSSLSATYSTVAPTDVVGTAANYKINRFNGSGWVQLSSTVSAPTVSTSASFNETTGTLGGNDFATRLNGSQTYTWTPITGSADFNTASNWTPYRVSLFPNDILQFSSGGSSTATNVPTQTIFQLLVSGSTNISLEAVSTNTLSINGTTAVTNLSVAAGSTLQVSTISNGNLTLNYGAVTGQLANIAGTLMVNPNGTYIPTNSTTTITSGGFYTHAKDGGTIPVLTWNAGSTLNVTGITATNITSGLSGTFPNLIWNNAAQTATGAINAALTISGNLTITAGTLFDNNFQITGNATGTLSVANGATLKLGVGAGTTFPTLYTTANISLGATSTVNYSATVAQSISGIPSTYGHLTISGGNTKTAGAAFSLAGDLTIAAGTFADAGFTITVNGNVSNASIHSGAGKILLSGGAASHTVSTSGAVTSFGTIELNDVNGATFSGTGTGLTTIATLTLTAGSPSFGAFTNGLAITNAVTIPSGVTLAITSATGNKAFGGDVTNNGTFTNSGNSTVSLASNLTNNGTFTAGTGIFTASGTTKTFSGSNTISIDNLNVTGSYTNNSALNFTVNSALTGAGSFVQGANALLILGGTSTITTLTATASPNTVSYVGTANQTAKGTTYHNLTINPSAGIIVSTGAPITVNNALTVSTGTFSNGSNFALTVSGSTSISSGATFNSSSTGATSFADFINNGTWNHSSAGTIGISGNFNNSGTSFTATGAYTFSGASKLITGSSATTIPTATISGNYTNSNTGGLTAGALTVGGTLTLNNNIAITGSFVANGTLITTGSAQVTGGGTFTLGGAATLNIGHIDGISALGSSTGAIVVTTARTYNGGANYIYSGTTSPQITGNALVSAGTLTINNTASSGTVRQTNPSVTVTGLLTLTAGTYEVGGVSAASPNTLVLSGPAIAGTPSNLVTTSFSNLSFTGASAGVSIPSSVTQLNLLTAANTSGLSINSNITLNANSTALTLTSCLLNLGANDLILSAGSTVSGTLSATNMVNADGSGQLKKVFPIGASSFIFPVGDATSGSDYSPFALTFTTNSVTRTIGVNVTDGTPPTNGAITDFASRFWTVSDNQVGIGTYAYNPLVLTYNAVAGDINGTVASYKVNRYYGSVWYQLNSTVASPTVSASSSYDQISGTLGGNVFAIRNNPPTVYTWLPTTGTADFNTATNWSPSRITTSNTDRLSFSSGGISTAFNVPTQTINQLTVSGNTSVSLEAGSTNTLTINGATATTNLSVASGSILQVSTASLGTLTLNYGAITGQIGNVAGTMIINSNGAFVTTNSTTTFASGSTFTHARDGGAIPVISWNTNATLNITGITSTNLTGGLTGTFGNLTWDNVGQTATGATNGVLTIAGNLTVANGTLFDNGSQITGNATGTLSIASGATLRLGVAATTFPTLFTTGNIALTTTSTVIYNSSAAQTISAAPVYGNLSITPVSGTPVKTAAGAFTVAGDLNISAGTFADAGFTITVNGNVTNTATHSGAGKILLAGGLGIHSLNGATATYGNLELQDAGTFNGTTTTVSGTTLVNGIATISSPSTVTLTGNVTIGANYNLANNGTATIAGILTGSNAVSAYTAGAGSTLNYSNGTTPMASGQFNVSAANNNVNYTGGTQTIRAAVYHNISFTAAGVKTVPDITINGSFVRTGGTFSWSGTALTFETSSAATITIGTATAIVFPDIIVNKLGGGTLTLIPTPTTTTVANLTITAGSFSVGSITTSFIVNGNLSGVGTFDVSGANHTLTLNGSSNAVSNFLTAGAGVGTVIYNGSTNQTMIASANYRNVTLQGTGIKSMTANSKIDGVLNFNTNVLLSLGGANLSLKSTATLVGTFSASRMIVTDGSGAFIKEGTTTADFTTDIPSGIYPLGNSGGLYTPFTLSALTATYTGTAYISIRAVPARQPNVPYYNNALIKFWDVVTANMTILSSSASFTFAASEVTGSVLLYEPRVWNGTTLSTVSGASGPSSNPFSTSGTTFLNGQWTAIDPTIRTSFYTYQSGDWSNLNTWTTDPSGTTLVSSIIPGPGDQVVVLPGRTLTTAISRTVGTFTVQSGGILDLSNTSGHNLGVIAGEGLIRLSSINLPAGTWTSFVAATGGTVEYYDLPAGTNVLSSTQATYNNLLFTNSTATPYTAVTNSNFTTNGDLTFSRTGSGTVTFLIGNAAGAWTNNFNKNLTTGAGCFVGVSSYDAAHTINLAGNLVVDGTITLTNGGANVTTLLGTATIRFTGSTVNTTATFNAGSSSKFYNVLVTKSDGYELFVSSAVGVTPLFHGVASTINVTLGTIRLGANISVPVLLADGGNYDLGAAGVLPIFWIDGANVTFAGTGGAFVPYGTLKITAGSFTNTTGQRSVVLRESGLFQIDGGTASMALVRTSTTAVTHRGSFVMSGGTLNLLGNNGGEQNYYSVFSLPYPENVFKMSGGTINITRASLGTITPNGGIMIASATANYDVTGGTVNINTTGNQHFDISSTASFYDVNIGRATAGTGQVRLNPIDWSFNGAPGNTATLPASRLRVLNNLVIQTASSPVFNAVGNNVVVGGNFTINSGSTFTTGANTLVFNGTGAQSFAVSGTITAPGLNNLTINKTGGSTLTLNGSAATISAVAAFTLTAGVLADNGKTLNVGGNVINNGSHTGSGKISLNGTVAQSIGGAGAGTFTNLEIAGGPADVTATNTVRVNGNLTLATNRIFNISIYKLILQANSAISGTFSSSRFIKTDGFLSDGGIVKPFNSTAAFVFPFGTGTNYTPATIQFNATPTTWGTLDVRPVSAPQLYVTDPDVFNYYWKTRQTGFTGVPAGSVTLLFNYGNLADNTTYIPGYYNYSTISFTSINNVNEVIEATNDIRFANVSYFEGDFTAGILAAFNTVVPYYSRSNGAWNVASTWSNTGHAGPASATIPTASRPVFIGNGTTYFHTITVPTNNTYAGSLIVDAGSTLDVGTTTGNNFGALPYSTAGGSGTVRISSAVSTAEFPAGDFGIFFTDVGGTAEYYTSGTSFTLPLITASPTSAQIRTYRNLNFTSQAGQTITTPNRDIEIYENVIVGGNTAGISTFNDVTARTFTIDGNLTVNSILRFKNMTNQSLITLGNITVSSTGTFDVENTGTALHALQLSGNLTNNGSVAFNQASDVDVTFAGTTNQSLTGSNGSAVTGLNNVTVNMGTDMSLVLDVNVAGTLTAPTNNWLNLQNGTFRLSKAATLTLNDQASSFLVPQTSAISINHASALINAGFAANDASDFILAGKLELLAGSMNVGNAANNNHNDLEYAPTNLPEIYLEGNSQLNVNGQIRRSVSVLLGSLKYTQKDNSVTLVRGKNPGASSNFNHNRAKFEITGTGSQFNMSNNSLLIIDRNGLASGIYGDLLLEPTASSITGGEIRFGTSLTPSTTGQNFFTITSNVPLWDVTIDGTTSIKTVQLLNTPISIQKTFAIRGNSIFNTNSLNVTLSGDFINENTTNTAGLSVGGYRPVSSTQLTTFNGAAASQLLAGFSGNVTNFANLTLNNTFGGGAFNFASNTNVRVNGNLRTLAGAVNANANNIVITGDVENNIAVSNTGAGYLEMAGTSAQELSGNASGTYVNLKVNNAAGIETIVPVSISGNLNFVTGQFYINNQLLTLTETASTSGTFSQLNMIRTNGVLSDAGVIKRFPASASAAFTFPIGITLKYTPAVITVVSNSVLGNINVKPVNTRHPATTDPLDKELTYYWNTTATGFSGGATFNQQYNYMNSDAINGNENVYVGGRFFGSVWVPQYGIAGAVNSTANTITFNGVNYLNGDYTAGETTEFDQLLIYYSRNATTGGNWNNVNSWSTDQILQHAGAASLSPPNFNQVIIASGHTITSVANSLNAPLATINGTLNLQNFIGNNFGTVSGTGTIQISPTALNQLIFPGGSYTSFVAPGGGTFEYQSSALATMPSQATYNGLKFTGAGTKNLFNTDLTINGTLNIAAGNVNNTNNKNIALASDLINSVGIGGLTMGTGTFTLSGTTQSLSGATQFYKLNVNGGGIKTLSSSINITNELILTSGIVSTGANRVQVPAASLVTGGSTGSYINGNLQRGIASATTSKTYPVGDATSFAPVTVSFTGATNGSGTLTVSTSAGDHPNIYYSGVDQFKSINRTWSIVNAGVTGFTNYALTTGFQPADLDGGVNTSNMTLSRYTGAGNVWESALTQSSTSSTVTGGSWTSFGTFQGGEFINGYIWTGNINTSWNLPSNWIPGIVPTASDNVTIGNVSNVPNVNIGLAQTNSLTLLAGANVTIPSGNILVVNGDMSAAANNIFSTGTLRFAGTSKTFNGSMICAPTVNVATGASLSLGASSQWELQQNLINGGTFIPGVNPVTFSGSGNSSISGNVITFSDLTMNKATALQGVILQSNVNVTGNLTMNTGDINLNGHVIDLGATGTLVNETAANRVYGATGSITAIRTLNAPSAVNVAGLGAELTSSANLGTTTVTRGNDQKVSPTGYGLNRHFLISPTNNTSLNATLKFNYFDDEVSTPLGTIIESELDLWRYDGSFWVAQFAVLNAAGNYLTKTGIPSFSPWTAGSQTNNPLPVTLLSLTVECNEGEVTSSWTTASEINNRQFLVQQSKDAVTWTNVLTVAGSGNSTTMRNYSGKFNNSIEGVSYIRLTQVDFNGKSEVFSPVSVNCLNVNENQVSLAPNPAVDYVNANFITNEAMSATITVFSSTGQLLLSTAAMLQNGSTTVRLDVSGLPKGVYFMKVSNDKGLEIKGNKTIIKM